MKEPTDLLEDLEARAALAGTPYQTQFERLLRDARRTRSSGTLLASIVMTEGLFQGVGAPPTLHCCWIRGGWVWNDFSQVVIFA